MSTPIVLFDVPKNRPFRFDNEPGDAAPLPFEALEAKIRATLQADPTLASGQAWITFDGPEPSAHPDFLRLVQIVGELGARARFVTHGWYLMPKEVAERLRDAGLAQLTFTFFGDAATHDRIVGHEGAFDRTIDALDEIGRLNRMLVTGRFVLLSDNHAETGPVVDKVRLMVDRFEVVRLATLTSDRDLLIRYGVKRRDASAAVQAAWEACRRSHVKMFTQGFTSWPVIPNPSDVPVQPVDGTLLQLLRDHVPVPGVQNGVWATPVDGDPSGLWFAVENARTLHDLALELAASGAPALDLPPSMGGLSLDHPPGAEDDPNRLAPMRENGVPLALARNFDPIDTRPLPAWQALKPGARVAVIAGALTDNILALSTLPALVTQLVAQGVDATLHTVWNAPFNPYDNDVRLPDQLQLVRDVTGVHRVPDDLAEAFANTPARIAHAVRQGGPWLATIDLSAYDMIIVPGYDNAYAVLQHPTLRPDTRVLVPDFHLMTGIGTWHQKYNKPGEKIADAGWWPSENVEISALYPRSARAYYRAGVPMRQIRWMPYPIHTGHFPGGRPTAEADYLFAGGAHQRDWKTLGAAARLLGPRARPIRAWTPQPVPAPVVSEGEVRLLHFHEALANSRFVVLPLIPDARRPAGISVISMALAAGRPVIASATHATIDHLRHGHNAILVPPESPEALAQAIARLDDDDALLAKLTAGARHAAAHVSVEAWATILVHGAPAQHTFTMDGSNQGPFYLWPA